MSNLDTSQSDDKERYVIRPKGVIFSIGFCILITVFFSFVLIATQLDLFPADSPEGYYFQKNGLFVNLLANVFFAFTLATALYDLRMSAVYWAFGMFLFDFLSTSYWILTSNWLGMMGVNGILAASSFWFGSCFIGFYCLKLRKCNILK